MPVNTLDPITVTSDVQAPDVSQLTTKALDGTGIFDVLMKSVKLHLTEEYSEDRITGEEYSTVYLGALGAVLQQSVAFLLNHMQEKKIAADIGLVRQKTVTELAGTANSLPNGLGFNTTTAIEGMLAAELAMKAKQEALIDQQVLSAQAEKDLYGQKIITEIAQTDNGISLAQAAGYGFNDAGIISGAMEGANAKSLMEARLFEQKLVTELAQTSETKPSTLGENVSTVIGGAAAKSLELLTSQVSKTGNESVLIAQKAITEQAQTSDTVATATDALTTIPTVTGMYGKQQLLYAAQTEGYSRDAEQKAAKMMIDAWSVNATVNAGILDPQTHLTYGEMGDVITKLRAGIGIV